MRAIDRLDAAIARGERALCGALFVAMIACMATNVVQRVFSRPEGRLSAGALAIGRAFGAQWDPAIVHGPGSTAINLAIGLAAALLAVRTSGWSRGWTWPRAIGAAIALTAVGAGLVALVLWLLPNGLVWGPAMALAGMLWTGFLGASVATHEKKHLALEIADKIWPLRAQRYVKAIALCSTAAACAVVCALSWHSIRDHLDTWLADPQAGILLPTAVPKWILLGVLPISWSIITLRIAGEGARVAAGIEPPAAALDEV